ncbi:MAG: hypothetical protein H6618_04220 [Deltaproteobacteria bacterium]|nr:hypothetical protein [Deltaproteobacteria bacterium]
MRTPPGEQRWQQLFDKRSETVIKPGLQRMAEAWDCLGYQKLRMKFVLIGGTNGKGSTSGMLWHLLLSATYRVGLFSSPHLCHFRERFNLSHQAVTDLMIEAALERIRSALPPALYQSLSFFELSTLIAVDLFRDQDCEIAVMEVGLGGRLDSVNIVSPVLTGICSVDLDHQAWLGSSYREIAQEKLGISRRKVPLFWNEKDSVRKGLEPLLRAIREAAETPLLEYPSAFFCDDQHAFYRGLPGESGDESENVLSVPLPEWVRRAPAILRHNFGMSFAMFACLLEQHPPAGSGLSYDRLISQAIHNFASPHAPWPSTLWGRFQRIRVLSSPPEGGEEPCPVTLFLDVAHNPAAVREFLHSLEQAGANRPDATLMIVSFLSDKDINRMLDILLETGCRLLLFRANSGRTFLPEQLSARHRELPVFDQFSDAWEYARQYILPESLSVAVCGSFLAVGEVLHYFSLYPCHIRETEELVGKEALGPAHALSSSASL